MEGETLVNMPVSIPNFMVKDVQGLTILTARNEFNGKVTLFVPLEAYLNKLQELEEIIQKMLHGTRLVKSPNAMI